MQTQSTESWLLLTQYSQKYGVSVSTIRRRIRSGKVEYKLMDGKYYIVDKPPMGMLPPSHSTVGGEVGQSPIGSLAEILEFCKNLIQSKEKMYQEILTDKMREIGSLKERISEQKMLIKILEEKLSAPALATLPKGPPNMDI